MSDPNTKEAEDFVTLTRAAAAAVKAAKADGVIDWRDAPKVVPLIGPLLAAVKGADKMVEGLKGASPEALEALAADALLAGSELVEAVLS